MVPRASLLMGRIHMHFTSASHVEGILKTEKRNAEMWDQWVVQRAGSEAAWFQHRLSDLRAVCWLAVRLRPGCRVAQTQLWPSLRCSGAEIIGKNRSEMVLGAAVDSLS